MTLTDFEDTLEDIKEVIRLIKKVDKGRLQSPFSRYNDMVRLKFELLKTRKMTRYQRELLFEVKHKYRNLRNGYIQT